MTMDGGKVVKAAPARARIYSLTSAVLMVLAVLGVVSADEIDADVLSDAVVEVVAAATLLMARLNVKLRGAFDQ